MNNDVLGTETADIVANAQLILHEREARDRCWWNEARKCFHPDSTVSLSWINGSGEEFVSGSERLARGSVTVRHRLSPPIVHLNGDRAVAVLGIVLLSWPTIDGKEFELAASMRLIYRTERRQREWRILSLDSVYESDTLLPICPGQALEIPAGELAELRPSYRLFAWTMGRRGIQIRQDLYGDDQPEAVARFYQDIFNWLGRPDIPSAS